MVKMVTDARIYGNQYSCRNMSGQHFSGPPDRRSRDNRTRRRPAGLYCFLYPLRPRPFRHSAPHCICYGNHPHTTPRHSHSCHIDPTNSVSFSLPDEFLVRRKFLPFWNFFDTSNIFHQFYPPNNILFSSPPGRHTPIPPRWGG